MSWLKRFKPWLWTRESRSKTKCDGCGDAERSSSEQSGEQLDWNREDDHDGREDIESENSTSRHWKRKRQKGMKHQNGDSANGGRGLKFRNLATYGRALRRRRKGSKADQNGHPVSQSRSQTEPASDIRGRNRQPIYHQPRSAAISFLRTTKQPAYTCRPRTRPPIRPYNYRSKCSVFVVRHRLSQVVEESESLEASRSRSRVSDGRPQDRL